MTFSGLNGDTAFKVDDVPVGRTSGEPYGTRRTLLVTVSIRMEWLTRQDWYDTVDHRQVSRPLDFAITTGVWNTGLTDIESGGATVQPLYELKSYTNGFTEGDALWLAALGTWHLNAMRAGCVHQAAYAGLDSPACPETGYRYGSKWLVRELPDGLLEEIQGLFKGRKKGVR
jgi:hypothetical protein